MGNAHEVLVTEQIPHGFQKRFWIPKDVDESEITAEWYESGDVLEIVLPKQQLHYERQQEVLRQREMELSEDAYADHDSDIYADHESDIYADHDSDIYTDHDSDMLVAEDEE